MIIFSKIEDNILILKIIENNNLNSLLIKIKITKNTLNNFRNLYHNLHKNTNHSFIENDMFIEFKDNVIKFSNDIFEYSLTKNNELVDMFDKIITNLMINDLDRDSPKNKD